MTISAILDQITAEEDRRRQEREAQSKSTNILESPLVKALAAGALGYATSGLANLALGAIPGMGAATGAGTGAAATAAEGAAPLTQATSMLPGIGQAMAPAISTGVGALKAPSLGSIISGAFAPSAETILPALLAGMGALKGGEPVSTGVNAGLAQPIRTMEGNIEKGVAERLKLTPEKYAKGEISYGRPSMGLTELEKLNIPGYTPSYTVGKGGATARYAPTKSGAIKDPTTKINNFYRTAPPEIQDQIDEARRGGYKDAEIVKHLGL